tara:strand:+ start:746 stop:937 length:192 start_codon:yes stop_codon:yes gene_type:complete
MFFRVRRERERERERERDFFWIADVHSIFRVSFADVAAELLPDHVSPRFIPETRGYKSKSNSG